MKQGGADVAPLFVCIWGVRLDLTMQKINDGDIMKIYKQIQTNQEHEDPYTWQMMDPGISP